MDDVLLGSKLNELLAEKHRLDELLRALEEQRSAVCDRLDRVYDQRRAVDARIRDLVWEKS